MLESSTSCGLSLEGRLCSLTTLLASQVNCLHLLEIWYPDTEEAFLALSKNVVFWFWWVVFVCFVVDGGCLFHFVCGVWFLLSFFIYLFISVCKPSWMHPFFRNRMSADQFSLWHAVILRSLSRELMHWHSHSPSHIRLWVILVFAEWHSLFPDHFIHIGQITSSFNAGSCSFSILRAIC